MSIAISLDPASYVYVFVAVAAGTVVGQWLSDRFKR